jgi:hypothetical protein
MAAAAGARISEDVIREILARLEEPSALLRCAATSRRWRALAADPSFLRRLWPDRSFVGFFTSEWRRGEGISLVPGPRSVLGAGRHLLSSYIPDAPGISDWVQPLASHRGLLLVRVFPREPFTMQLAVCDPLAGRWEVLPTLRVNEARYFVGYAIVVSSADRLSSSSSLSGSASFRVLLISTEEDTDTPLYWDSEEEEEEDVKEYMVHAFSSGQPSWSSPFKFPADRVELSLVGATVMHPDAAVCRGGVAHWLFAKSTQSTKLHIVHVNSETVRITSTQLVIPPIPGKLRERIRLTTTTDKTMLSLCTYDGDRRRVEIWEQQHRSEDGNIRWLRTKVIELELREQLEGERWMCLGAKSGRLLILMDPHQRVYVLDLKGLTMEATKDRYYGTNQIVVMEIDWPVFFRSRLRLM